MDQLPKKIELAANLSIILVTVLLGAVLVKKYVIGVPAQNSDFAVSVAQAGTNAQIGLLGWIGPRTERR
jgi:hypothetical protein